MIHCSYCGGHTREGATCQNCAAPIPPDSLAYESFLVADLSRFDKIDMRPGSVSYVRDQVAANESISDMMVSISGARFASCGVSPD